jgi:c-di-GMP-binding flagellar brake protein YcgR
VRSENHQLRRIDKMSKGEIAFAVFKSNPPRMGEIIEISRGGLSFSYIDNATDLTDFSEMDILFVDEDFHLTHLPFKTVEDEAIVDSNRIHTFQMKRQTVKFKNLSDRQKKQLEYVLKNFTTGEVPKQGSKQVWGSG